jgi:PPOX class probable F420-dependent enzyme
VARLAIVTAAGQPRLVPLVFAVDGDRVLSVVDAKPKPSTARRRMANVMENPLVSMLVDHYDDDWSALWWVRADGTGVVHETGSAARKPQSTCRPRATSNTRGGDRREACSR